MSTIYRSRTVIEDAFYQVDFTTFGIQLTKLTSEETMLLPLTHWVYLYENMYLEGSDYNNYVKRMDVVNQQLTMPILPQGIVMNNGNDQLFTDYDANPTTIHTCKYVPYMGLNESFNYCFECGKKQ